MTVSPSRESRTLPRLGCRNKGLENSVEVGRQDGLCVTPRSVSLNLSLIHI